MHVYACVCMCLMYSKRYLFSFLHPVRPQLACRPQRRRCPAVCLPVQCMFMFSQVCACMHVRLISAYDVEHLPSLGQACHCGSYWAGTFRMTSSNGDKADRSRRLWLLLEKRLLPKVCVSVCVWVHNTAFFNIDFHLDSISSTSDGNTEHVLMQRTFHRAPYTHTHTRQL